VALFVMFHSPGPAWDHALPYAEQPGVMEHIGFMRSLDERGVMILGGPFESAETGEPVGMVVAEAEDLAAARALAEEDGSLRSGLLTANVRPWRPRMGRALRG
jgi:uncharacterized protein YciI